jgi:hypothetical protein
MFGKISKEEYFMTQENYKKFKFLYVKMMFKHRYDYSFDIVSGFL